MAGPLLEHSARYQLRLSVSLLTRAQGEEGVRRVVRLITGQLDRTVYRSR